MERGHPVRLSAKREHRLKVITKAERAAHAGGQDVRAPGITLLALSPVRI